MDTTAETRHSAFSVSLALAAREGANQTNAVLDRAILNPHADVRLAGLRACKEHGSPALVPRLIEAADGRPAERFLVIDALAAIPDPAAHAKVLSTAQDEKLPRAERLRAVALLSRTRHEAGLAYLKDLSGSRDDAFRSLAIETLAMIQAAAQTTR